MVVEGYLESIELFYDEKIKFLSNKDNFISCNNCPNKKEFLEKHDEIILNCGGDGKDCGVKVHIKFPKYLHYERDVKSLNDKLEKELNLEEINKYIDVSSKLKDQKLKKKIIEEKVNEITEQFYKINVENKKDHIYKFYKSRVDKTKKCKEIQKKLNEPLLDGTLKKSLRIEYITLIKKLNEEYRYALSTNVEDPLNPEDAKKFGGKKSFQENGFTLRADWDKVKLRIMKEITREYYLSNQDFRDKLIKTGNKKLVHSGFRIDDYWGVKKTGGENNHGKILMELREELSN